MRKTKKQQKTPLGRALAKDKQRRQRAPPSTHEFLNYHSTEIEEQEKKSTSEKLSSVTHTSAMEELLTNARLAEKSFVAEKQNVVVLSSMAMTVRLEPTPKQLELQLKYFNDLRIPRRPKWDTSMSAEQLDFEERQAFLDWRRTLAEMEQNEDLVLTPFEKNLEVWRQLWRVVERSDIVIQIVDARNPMVRCTDLEAYVKEVDPTKHNLLLVNKADLLTRKQRKMWAEYFESENTQYIFWSANYERAKLEEQQLLEAELEKAESQANGENDDIESSDEEIKPSSAATRKSKKAKRKQARKLREQQRSKALNEEEDSEENEEEEADDEEEEQEANTSEAAGEEKEKEKEENVDSKRGDGDKEDDGPQIFTSDMFFDFLLKLCPPETKEKGQTVVGMVGYPNVGKSSTINVLCGEKRVAVAITPGKTKHLQTIELSKELLLCDCPGLVFPSFLTTKPEMICSGLLPIDHMTDHVAPMTLVCKRIPRRVLERVYGVILPPPGEGEDPNRPPTAAEFLDAYARIRGFMSPHGPDQARAARIVLKDYLAGKLLYCHPPPDAGSEWQQWYADPSVSMESLGLSPKLFLSEQEEAAERQHKIQNMPRPVVAKTEVSFGNQDTVVAHVTGKAGRRNNNNFTRVQFSHSPVARGRGRGRGGGSSQRGRGGVNY